MKISESAIKIYSMLEAMKGREFTLGRIHDLSSPISSYDLAKALIELVKEEYLKKIIRIENKDHIGLEEFDSLEQLPEFIDDPNIGYEIKIEPENIKIIYRKTYKK